VTKILLKIIRFYQRYFSSGRACRFLPSCSEYTYQAIRRYGIIRGAWMGAKRISRCHAWHEGGWDPL